MTTHTTHTPGPWSTGITLKTLRTRQWTESEIAVSNAQEKRRIFTNFSSLDEGRSRTLVATCENMEDATHIVHCVNTYPALVEALKEMLLYIEGDNELQVAMYPQSIDMARKALALARKEAL